MIKKIINEIARIATLFIYPEEKREIKKTFIVRKLRTLIYGRQVLKVAQEIGEDFACNNYSTVNSKTFIKNHVNFNGMRVQGGGKVIFGNNFHSGEECLIITSNHNYEGDLIPYDSKYISKDVIIGDCVWLGSRVTILPGTEIGNGVIVQAGAVVKGKIPPCAIIGGNPAKVFKYRNIENFEKLYKEGKFRTTITCIQHKFAPKK